MKLQWSEGKDKFILLSWRTSLKQVQKKEKAQGDGGANTIKKEAQDPQTYLWNKLELDRLLFNSTNPIAMWSLNTERKTRILFTANTFSCTLMPKSKLEAEFILKHGQEF